MVEEEVKTLPIENNLPVAHEGLPYIVVPLGLAVIALFLIWWLAVPLFIFAGFSLWFFRDPERTPPGDDFDVLSPADGTVIDVRPVEETRYLQARSVKISIFMSIFNVHVNRAPVGGRVKRAEYFPGKFFAANLDKSSEENERNALVVETETGKSILFIQIAGLVARRIACWIIPSDNVVRGQRVGLIRFGSRLDVYVPEDTVIKVKKGDKVKAGESIIGRLADALERTS